jgi:hypothetical protein
MGFEVMLAVNWSGANEELDEEENDELLDELDELDELDKLDELEELDELNELEELDELNELEELDELDELEEELDVPVCRMRMPSTPPVLIPAGRVARILLSMD